MADKAKAITLINSVLKGKAIIVIWIIIVSILIGFVIAGYLQNELISYILLSLFPATVLTDATIIIGYKGKKTDFQFIKAGWTLLCICVVIFSLIVVDTKMSDSYLGAGILIIYPMMILSFPSGYLWISLYSGIIYAFDYFGLSFPFKFEQLDFYITNFILWFGFILAGYLQWFKLIPFLIKKWQNRKS